MIHKGQSQAGFTLIEILVAMALVAVILFMATGAGFSSRGNLDEMLDKIERIVRFASDEASLKNQFVRLSIDLSQEEPPFKLEYSEDPNLVLEENSGTDSSLREKEAEDKKAKEFDKNFSEISEFEASDFSIPVGVKIVAIGSSLRKELIKDSVAQIYFYPTGEKDSAIIILSTDTEIATLEVSSFVSKIERKYITLEDVGTFPSLEKLHELADGIYKEWLEK